MTRNFHFHVIAVTFLSTIFISSAIAQTTNVRTQTHLSLAQVDLFQKTRSFEAGGYWAHSVAVADLNSDGRMDLITLTTPGIGVLLGNSTKKMFDPVVMDSASGAGESFALADLNSDGKLDVAMANGWSGATVLLGNGDGMFQPPVVYDSGGYNQYSIAVADVNGDGIPDLVAANSCLANCSGTGSIGVLLGNGDGTFQPAVTYDPAGYGPVSVVTADVNGDGKPDLVVADRGTVPFGNVAVLLGRGDGTFDPAVSYPCGGRYPWMVAVADLNGDAKPDIVVVDQFSDVKSKSGAVAVLFGNGDGTFQPPVSYPTYGKMAMALAVADLDHNDTPDLAVVRQSDVIVLLNNGYGGFQLSPEKLHSGGKGAWSIAASDVNRDGKADLVVGTLYHNSKDINARVSVILAQ